MSEKTALLSCCGGVVFLAAVIMLACCWDTVEPTEYGIIYNTLTKKLSGNSTYEGGRYFVGLTAKFITFPSVYISMEFSENEGAAYPPLVTRTKEGLDLTLSISFQAELVRDEIPDLYYLTNGYYENTFSKVAKDIIFQVAGQFEAQSYWLRRQAIADEIRVQLNAGMRSAHATIPQIQVLKIVLPSSYEQSIVDTQVEVQKRTTKEYERQATLIRESINIDISEANREIQVINATAKARAYEINQNAVATQLEKTISIETDIYQQTSQKLNFTNSELNQYIYYVSTMGKNYTLLSNIQNAVVKV